MFKKSCENSPYEMEQHILDTNAGKQVLSCYRCLNNTGGQKMNYI